MIPKLGQKSLNLSDDDGKSVKSVFQMTAVTRPLMSVGRICDEGHNITSDAVMSMVRDTHDAKLCRSQRQQGGLYVAKLKLRNPMGFAQLE